MTGPWEQYQKKPAGPWEKYAKGGEQAFVGTLRQEEPSTNIEDMTQPSAIGQWAKGVDDRVRAVARGVPLVGPYMDEIAAGLNTGFGAMGDYDKALAAERARDETHRRERPWESTIGETAGVIGGFAAAAPLAVGRVPATMLGKMVASGTAAGVQGLVEGFGRGEGGAGPRARRAVETAAIAAPIGALMPPVAAGVGKVAKWGAAGWQRMLDRLKGQPATERRALISVLRTLEESGMSADDAAAKLDDLGPQGMLADVNEGLQLATGQAARRDLGAAKTVGSRLTARNEAAGERVGQYLDDAFGPSKDPYIQQQVTRVVGRDIGKGYEPLYDSPVPYTFELEKLTKRIPATALRKANELMQIEGVQSKQILAKLADDGRVISFERVPDMRQWDYIQRGLRALSEAEVDPTGKTTALGKALGGLRRDLMEKLDDAAPEFIPLRQAYYGNEEVQRAFDTGLDKVLHDRKMTPARLVAEQAERSPAAREALMQGVRTDLDMSLSNARRSPGLQADRLLTQNWNDQKMRELLGPQRADELSRRIGTEETFIDTTRLASPGRGGGSRTGFLLPDQRPATQELGDIGIGIGVGVGTGQPWLGVAAGVLNRLKQKGMTALADRSQRELARASAELLTATGQSRADAVRDLGKIAAQMRKAGAVEEAAEVMSLITLIPASARAGEAAQPYLPR